MGECSRDGHVLPVLVHWDVWRWGRAAFNFEMVVVFKQVENFDCLEQGISLPKVTILSFLLIYFYLKYRLRRERSCMHWFTPHMVTGAGAEPV